MKNQNNEELDSKSDFIITFKNVDKNSGSYSRV